MFGAVGFVFDYTPDGSRMDHGGGGGGEREGGTMSPSWDSALRMEYRAITRMLN